MCFTTEIETPTVTYTQPLGLFINNEWVPGLDGRSFEVFSPQDERLIAVVAEASGKDVDIAVKAARDAFEGPWKTVTPSERGRLLVQLADLFEKHSDTLAAIESLDNGKALSMAKADVANSAGCLRYYGGWADKIVGQTIDTDPKNLTYTRHVAVGVCGQIIPWNFPLLMWSWKIGPAVAVGNTVVIKTAEQTPLSALYAAQLCKEAGFPPGVINIISGFGRIAGAALASHMDVDKIAFTGSTAVGRSILQAAAKSNMKKVRGKSPSIVFPDADLDNALSWVNFGIYYNHGQCCCAGSRILVHKDIVETFMEKFRHRAAQNKVGNPFDPDTFQGPQISKVQFDRIMGYIDDGKKAGAKLEVGGNRIGSEGFFIEPTIFSNVTEDMSIVKEEIFGPVCTVQTFASEEEAIRLANNTSYGLAAAVHTTNINTAVRVSEAVKAGTVWVNTYNTLSYQAPFGGFKESGLGRELGSYALDNYTQVKTVRVYTGDALFG
ncbi:aldehyde dehydrogenase [Penicillium riverlandense]|uniref:aldehyde dehydrogenase n=1 Tax=Penicillium riverlandense TaxID=1903569 RepID=UPI0025472543|nr:aldehyde dehydrogenase [Penicillium riverlandense]KAJ5819450.1 aldehyde dehydrogenase [Penicillium riverlandense]